MKRFALTGLAVLLAACSQPEAAPSRALDPELGQAPTVIESEPSPVAEPTQVSSSPPATQRPEPPPPSDGTSSAVGESAPEEAPSPQAADGSTGSPAPEPGQTPAPPVADDPVVLLSVADAGGDHGARGPTWADLRSLEMVEVGNDLRVTLRLGGDLPATPPEGEVPLLGVNIGDEGYQLFVEGGGQSWAAYLDTPEGFVEYPGTFELAGSAMVLQVPFSAVGSPTSAPVRAFVEWSRDSGVVGVLNPSSEDTLDGEPHTFDRAA